MGTTRTVTAVATLATALGISGCGGHQTEAAPPAPTVTVTATLSVEKTITASPAPQPLPTETVTVTASPSDPAEADAPEDAPEDGVGDLDQADEFDHDWARTAGDYVVEDMREVEVRLGDGIGVSSSLSFLSDSYGDLLEAGVPPSADPAAYKARLSTLSMFAADAAQIWDSGNTMEAAAKYEIIRKETGPLFGVLNRELGSNFRVPAR